MKSGKTRFAGPPLLSRLRRRFAPLRGTQRRCAALFFAPPGRYAPCALRAQPFWKHEKNAGFCTSGASYLHNTDGLILESTKAHPETFAYIIFR